MGSGLDQVKGTGMYPSGKLRDSAAETQNPVVSWWAQWLGVEGKKASSASAGGFLESTEESYDTGESSDSSEEV